MIALAALLAAAGSGAPAPPCPAGTALAYVCGAEKPEDLMAIPGTRWLIASGFAPGSGLKLVDTRARTATPWFTGTADQIAADAAAFPRCPGPPDPALFDTRGLSLRATGPGHFALHVVNHGGRESIERFDVELGNGAPQLRWRGCLPMPAGQVGNSVATFADMTVIATVLTRPGTTIADFVQGKTTGAVWQLRPGDDRFRMIEGTELPGNNGLEVDPDDRHFYVVAFGWHAVLVYERGRRRPLRRIDMPDFMPDNIHWSGGRLLAAGMRLDEPACGGLRRIVDGEADKMFCHRGYGVAEIDPANGTVRSLAYGAPEAAFNGVSAAAVVGDELWLGSYQADRIAVRTLPESRDGSSEQLNKHPCPVRLTLRPPPA
jgi:hypothetical protein